MNFNKYNCRNYGGDLPLMMLFSTGTGMERVGVVWPDLACWRAGLQAPNVVFLCKNKKEEGSARASPMAAPMPKSVSF